MTAKLQRIVELAASTARTVTNHPDRWADFFAGGGLEL